jgi:hypothetical protein
MDMLASFLTTNVFWVFDVWQILLFLVVIALVVFLIQYRKRQM